MKSQTAGKQSITISNVNNIFVCCSGSSQCARTAILPKINIMLCIESNDTLTRGSRCGMNTNAFGKGLAAKSVRISDTEVVLGQKRKLVKICRGFDVIGCQTFFFHLLTVVGNVVPNVLYLRNKSFILPCKNLFAGSGFNFGLIVAFHG